jgi:hypothetical protein
VPGPIRGDSGYEFLRNIPGVHRILRGLPGPTGTSPKSKHRALVGRHPEDVDRASCSTYKIKGALQALIWLRVTGAGLVTYKITGALQAGYLPLIRP